VPLVCRHLKVATLPSRLYRRRPFRPLELGRGFFVTRLMENAAFEVVEECGIPQNRNIRADQFIGLTA
jgi:hypothetical protein